MYCFKGNFIFLCNQVYFLVFIQILFCLRKSLKSLKKNVCIKKNTFRVKRNVCIEKLWKMNRNQSSPTSFFFFCLLPLPFLSLFLLLLPFPPKKESCYCCVLAIIAQKKPMPNVLPSGFMRLNINEYEEMNEQMTEQVDRWQDLQFKTGLVPEKVCRDGGPS